MLQTPTVKNIAQPDYQRLIKYYYFRKWQIAWCQSTRMHCIIKPELGCSFPNQLERRAQVCYFRMKLNTTVVTHQHYFNKQQVSYCNVCQMPVTAEHLLMSCSLYKQQKLELKRCEQVNIKYELVSILSSEVIVADLINYLHATNLFNLI